MKLENLPSLEGASNPGNMTTFILAEVIPFVIGLIAGVLIFFFSGSPYAVIYAVSAVFGGITLWVILLLYRFINYLVYFFWYIHETTAPLMDTLVAAFGGPGKVDH